MTSKSLRRFRIGRSRTGLGLFATGPIRKRQFIARYWGRRIPNDIADQSDGKYMFELDKKWTLDGSTRRNLARYANHSCRPNAEADVIKGKVIIRAIKAIQPDDEITYNYGKDYREVFFGKNGCKCDKCREQRAAERAARECRRLRAERREAASSRKREVKRSKLRRKPKRSRRQPRK